MRGFSDSSVGKESACNTGDPSSIPRSGRSPREGKGYPVARKGSSILAWRIYSPWGHRKSDTTKRLSLTSQ